MGSELQQPRAQWPWKGYCQHLPWYWPGTLLQAKKVLILRGIRLEVFWRDTTKRMATIRVCDLNCQGQTFRSCPRRVNQVFWLPQQGTVWLENSYGVSENVQDTPGKRSHCLDRGSTSKVTGAMVKWAWPPPTSASHPPRQTWAGESNQA